MERYALIFEDHENLMRALEVIEDVTAMDAVEGRPPIELHAAGAHASLVPEWAYRRLKPFLDRQGIRYVGKKAIAADGSLFGEEHELRGGKPRSRGR